MAMVPRVAFISVQKLFRRSDYTRWSNSENLEKWWESRTQRLAGFIPAGSRVVEFGAGRGQLRRYLASGCTYVPSDLTARFPDTIVCDLNGRPLPDLRHLKADVAVFSGVLEYIGDLSAVAKWLSQQTSAIVASYDSVKSAPASIARFAELYRRRYFGYLSNHTVGELEAIFARAGFRCVQTDVWNSQQIMVFASERSPLIAGVASPGSESGNQ
jgi:hypothetical protein